MLKAEQQWVRDIAAKIARQAVADALKDFRAEMNAQDSGAKSAIPAKETKTEVKKNAKL